MAVDDAWHDVLAGAVDDARVRGVEILADRGDLAVAQEYVRVLLTITHGTLRISVSRAVCAWVALSPNRATIERKRSRFIDYSAEEVSHKDAKADTKAQRRIQFDGLGPATVLRGGRRSTGRPSMNTCVTWLLRSKRSPRTIVRR